MTMAFSPPKGAVLDKEGVWCQVFRDAHDGAPRPALFLDRDGVILEETGYIARPEDAHLVPGAATIIAEANRRGIAVVLITNQAGIACGYFGWDAFAAVQEKLLAALTAAGASVDGVFACPHHAEGQPPYRHPDHPARKPNPGMLHRAQALLRLDLARSWIVGDRAIDVEAGRNAGLAGGVIVATGYGAKPEQRAAAQALATSGFIVRETSSVADVPGVVPLLSGHRTGISGSLAY
jgi:D-glycero-D-manno-heptose 1,7-bisphosphate phosphatase